MDVKNSNIPPAPRYTLPRVGWSVGKTVRIVKTPIADRSHLPTFFFYVLFRLLFAKYLKTPLENFWVLRFPSNYSDYSFGPLLVFWRLCFFRF